MQAQVLAVQTRFVRLKNTFGDTEKVKLTVSIYFHPPVLLDITVPGKGHFHGHVLREIEYDSARQDEYDSDLYYVLDVIAYDDMNPAYDAAVNTLLGEELSCMLSLTWREAAISLDQNAGVLSFDGVAMAREIHQMERDFYQPSVATAQAILDHVLDTPANT